MMFVVVVLLAVAAISIGFRTVGGLLQKVSHPVDRLVMAVIAGVMLVGLVLGVSNRLRVLEAGLGLVASLAPVGVFDLAKWWHRSRHPFSPWLVRADASTWVVVLRWLLVAGVVAAALAVAGLRVLAAISGPPESLAR